MVKPITTQQNLLTEINERLQCPICLELPKNKVYICESCSCSYCEGCYKKFIPRQFVTNAEATYFVKFCPQNFPVPLYRPNPIQNLLWNQLAELFRNNSHLVSPEKGFWNIKSAIKYLRENNKTKYLAPLVLLLFLIVVAYSPFFQTDIDSSTLPCLKTWNASSIQDQTREYFRIEKDSWKGNKTDSDQITFLNLIFKETPKWPKRDLEWLRNGTLFLAAQYGSLESFFYILEKPNIYPDIIDEDGIAPLHLTLIDEDEQRGERKANILQLFGADVVNLNEASTALHAAAKWGSLNIMKTLLKGNSDPNAKDAFGLTPLFLAMKNENEKIALEIIEELLRHGANCSVTNKNETADPLDIARQHRTINFLRNVENLYEKYQPECLEANFRRHEAFLNQLKQLGWREEVPVFYYGKRQTKFNHKIEFFEKCRYQYKNRSCFLEIKDNTIFEG